MATSKTHARRPNRNGPPDARDADPLAKNPTIQSHRRADAGAQPPTTKAVSLDIAPSPDAGEAVTLRQQAAMLVVEDKASHVEALEFLRGAKQLKRKIEDHWSRITRNVDELKRNLLDLKRADLEPVDAAIALADRSVVTFVNAEQERQRLEADRQRRENEAAAQRRREVELAEAEEEALRLEASSATLSARETAFAHYYMDGQPAARAASLAGYKNPAETAAKLLGTAKINDHIASRRAAAAVRAQADAIKAQPMTVAAPVVESNLGKVSGTRMVTSYSCDPNVDVDALFVAVKQGADRRALKPDLVFLNGQARMLRESFEAVYPGCKVVKSQTTAG